MITDLKDVVSRNLKTIPCGSPLFEAEKIMNEFRIRHLPVVDETNEIVGVLSQRDLRAAQGVLHSPVDFFMSAPVEYVTEDTPMRTAIIKMIENKISCLLVSEKNGDAVGIVTTDDLLWYLAHQLRDEAKDEQGFVGSMAEQTVGSMANMLSNIGI